MRLNRLYHKWLLMPFARKHVHMPGRRSVFNPPQLTPDEKQIEQTLRDFVYDLAGSIGERHRDRPEALTRARTLISTSFESLGYTISEHAFADGVNLVARTSAPAGNEPPMLIGAHYDTVPGSPGANDNASGVACMLELARKLRGCNVRFVAFDNEEHVGQPATAMGSYVYARECKRNGENIRGMWSLETLGYYSDEHDSQAYPPPLDLFYPTTGNFAAFVSSASATPWVRQCVRTCRELNGFPAEGVAAPDNFTDVNRSDHWGFLQAGYPALMVTDTANFRYKPYHTADDTPDQVNYTHLARLTAVLAETAQRLSSRPL